MRSRIQIDEKPEPTFQGGGHVTFGAIDGTRITGTLFGDPSKARITVALAHMGQYGDDQQDWYRAARELSSPRVAVLTFNRRGVCDDSGRCSRGADDFGSAWKDIVGSARFLRRNGAERIVVGGASIGAMASLDALRRMPTLADGVVWFAGIRHGSGYAFSKNRLAHLQVPALFLSTRRDPYGALASTRSLHRFYRGQKRLIVVAGHVHGTEVFERPWLSSADQVIVGIKRFLNEAI